MSIQLTAVNYTAVNLQVWGLDGTGVLPVQPYRTNCIVRLRCAALVIAPYLYKLAQATATLPKPSGQYWERPVFRSKALADLSLTSKESSQL